jgi:hypothetical protein
VICEPCRRDVHLHCPELFRQAAAEGIVAVSELAYGQQCDCAHKPRRTAGDAD